LVVDRIEINTLALVTVDLYPPNAAAPSPFQELASFAVLATPAKRIR